MYYGLQPGVTWCITLMVNEIKHKVPLDLLWFTVFKSYLYINLVNEMKYKVNLYFCKLVAFKRLLWFTLANEM